MGHFIIILNLNMLSLQHIQGRTGSDLFSGSASNNKPPSHTRRPPPSHTRRPPPSNTARARSNKLLDAEDEYEDEMGSSQEEKSEVDGDVRAEDSEEVCC